MAFHRIEYGSHPLQGIDVRVVDEKNGTWIVYIHGGAWRDAMIDASEGHPFLQHLTSNAASIDYRLSPEVRHPEHQNDLSSALSCLRSKYTVSKLILVGHSAGAFMARMNNQADYVIGLDGIYDLKELVKEYPQYRDFVENAFGYDTCWPECPTPSAPIMLLHSDEDELLSWNQTKLHQSQYGGEIKKVRGTHQEVMHSSEFLSILQDFEQEFM